MYIHKCLPACWVSSVTSDFATPWTVARQAPLSMGFSRQEYWSGLLCPPPGDLPNPGIKPSSSAAPALQVGPLTTEPPRKPHIYTNIYAYICIFVYPCISPYIHIYSPSLDVQDHRGSRAQLRKNPSKRFSLALDFISGRSKNRFQAPGPDITTTYHLKPVAFQEVAKNDLDDPIGVAQLCHGGGVSGHHCDTVLVGWP